MIGSPTRPAPLPDAARLAARQRVVLHMDRAITRATMIAPAEGNTRFVSSVTCAADLPDHGVTILHTHLSHETGELVRDPEVAIVSRPPFRLLAIGTPEAADAVVLGTITTLGIVQIVERITPPHGPERETEWIGALLERIALRDADGFLLFMPPGALAGWVARLFNAIHALARFHQPPCIVRGCPPDLADVVPASAVLVAPDRDLAEAYTNALAYLVGQRLGLIQAPRTVLFRVPALVTALVAAERVLGTSLLYLDTSDGTTLIFAEGGKAQVFRDAAADVGVGAATLLARIDEEHIRRWLPFPIPSPVLRGWAVRRAAWPAAVPLAANDRLLTAAFAREAVRILVAQAGVMVERCGICVLGPGASAWGTPGQVLLAAMDMISLAGPVPITQDMDDLLPVIGWLAHESPESAAALFTHDALTDIGTVVPVFGTGGPNETALRVALAAPPQEHATAIAWDTLVRLPAPDGPVDLYTLGRGDTDFQAVAVRGGSGGILIDARGRPLLAASNRDEQREQMRRWLGMVDPRGGPR